MFFQKVYKTKLAIIFAALIILLIFSARVLFLDRDLPPWGIINYQPVDEGSYSVMALNYENYGVIQPDKSITRYPSYIPPHVRVNVIGNAASYVGLKVFGDNYYGARLPYVFFGTLNFLLIFCILLECRKKYKKTVGTLWGIMGIMLYLSVDFTLLMSSRVVEPSSVRLLFILLTVFAFLRLEKKSRTQFFLCGMLITVSVFGVYITNVFMYLAIAIVLLYKLKNEGQKAFWSCLVAFVSGSLIVFGVCEIYYFKIWNTGAIINMLKSIFDFSAVSGYSGARTLKSTIKTVIRFFSANSLLYSVPVLLSTLLAIPILIKTFVKTRDYNLLFLLSVPACFFLQTMFSEDYIVRKFIVVYPIFVVLSFLGYFLFSVKISETFEREDSEETGGLKLKLSNLRVVRYIKGKGFSTEELAKIIYFVLALGLCICAVAFRILIVDDGTRRDFTLFEKSIVIIAELAPLVFIGLNLLKRILKREIITVNFTLRLFLIGFVFAFAVNLYFDIDHVFLNNTYSEKEAMIELKKIANDRFVLGEYENGFTLYNNVKPVLNTYENLKMYMVKDTSLYYFDYYDDYNSGMRTFFDNELFSNSKYTVIPIKEFKREFQVNGEKRSMALYKVVKKQEAIQYYSAFFETLKRKKYLTEEEREFLKKTPAPYVDYYGDFHCDINNDIYVNIHGNIYGDVYGDIYGNVYGDIYGDVYGDISGKIYGKIYGKK